MSNFTHEHQRRDSLDDPHAYEDFDDDELHSNHPDGEQEDGYLVPAPGTHLDKKPFQITNLRGVNWLAQKILALRQSAADAKAWCAEIKEYAQSEEERLMSHFGPQAEAVVRQEARRGTKTLPLPSASVSLKFSPAGLDVEEEAVCLAWCQENAPEALTTEVTLVFAGLSPNFLLAISNVCDSFDVPFRAKESVSKSELNRFFEQHGILPDGCTHRASVEKLHFKAPKEASQGDE